MRYCEDIEWDGREEVKQGKRRWREIGLSRGNVLNGSLIGGEESWCVA